MLTAATGASGSGDMMRRSPLPSRSSVKLIVGAAGACGAAVAVGACPLPAVMGASVSVQVRQVGQQLGAVALYDLPSLANDGGRPRAGGGRGQVGVRSQTY